MTYYLVPKVYDQVIVTNAQGKTDFLIAGELLTQKECIEKGVPKWVKNAFRPVTLKRSETYWFFGARFPANEELIKTKVEG